MRNVGNHNCLCRFVAWILYWICTIESDFEKYFLYGNSKLLDLFLLGYFQEKQLKAMQKTLLDWTQKTKKVKLFRINYCYSKAWFGPFAFQGSLIVSYFGLAVLIWIIVDFASLFTSSEKKKRIEHTFFVFLLCDPFYSCHYTSLRWSFPKLSLNLYRSCKAKMWLKRNF